MVGPTSPQPIALPAVRRLAPAAIGCRERNNITKFPKNNTKFRPPCRHSQRSSLPFPCANYELCQHDVRLPHSAALPPPLPHTFTPNPPSNSTTIALIPVSLHFCRLWVPNLVSGCWVCVENELHNLLGVQDRSPSTTFFVIIAAPSSIAVICVLFYISALVGI